MKPVAHGTQGFRRSGFPDDFLFGAASSSYQIEGHAFGGAGSTHWDTFAATPGNVHEEETGNIACNHYHRYRDDLAIASEIGLDAWRFSTSWSRVQPDGKGKPNSEGLAFYDRLVDAMLEQGLKPCLTLYHWELPSALADLGGWANPEIANWFGDYAALVGNCLGDRIHSAAPINEPWCVAWLGHFTGDHAPGLRDIRATARVMHHLPLAHEHAVAAMRSEGMTNIGTVMNFEFPQPVDDSEENIKAAHLYDAIYNRWFTGAICTGCYPPSAIEYLGKHLPQGWEKDLNGTGQEIDWIGINYYTRKIIGSDGRDVFPGWKEFPGPLPKTGMGWEIYPQGLGHFMNMVHEEYADGRPIYVTESGMSDPLDQHDPLDDQLRWEYVNLHVAEVIQAIRRGIDVRGFFIWSILDNYEWSLGYRQRFGLVHVDRTTLDRQKKWSCEKLRKALET